MTMQDSLQEQAQEPLEIKIPIVDLAQTERKASVLLAEASNLPHSKVKDAMQLGAVWLGSGKQHRRIRRADARMKVGDTLAMYYNQRVLAQSVASPVLVEDAQDYSLWFKPSGVLSQGSLWGDHTTINRLVERHLTPHRQCFLVHRLDKAASGLILIAHSKKTAAHLAQQFEKRSVEKRYHAIVYGDANLLLGAKNKTIDTPVSDKPALSHVQVLGFDEQANRSLLSVSIETGRKHQIRQHLSSNNLYIVGDRLYANIEADVAELVSSAELPDLQLRSYYLKFHCPVTNTYREFELPEAMQLRL